MYSIFIWPFLFMHTVVVSNANLDFWIYLKTCWFSEKNY